MGIAVVRDMPAVGANLHDHFGIYMHVALHEADHLQRPREQLAAQDRRRACSTRLTRGGPMAVNGIRAGLFTRTDRTAGTAGPADQPAGMEHEGALKATGVIPHPFPGFTLCPVHLTPDGRGTVRLASPDPLAPPEITFGFLGTEYDMRAMVAGVQLARRIAEQPALKPYDAGEIFPGPGYESDADLERFVREAGLTNHHPAGSCAMGTGTNTVVDPRLRVHGIAGLRVADASIMPSVVAGNTNAPSIMIGEKCAAMVLEDAA